MSKEENKDLTKDPIEDISEKYLIFTVENRRYALPSKIISEVAVLEKVFPLPLVPEYVKGIINRYSIPYVLIDINYLLSEGLSNASKVIVLKEEVDKLALLIDDVTDIADLFQNQFIKTEAVENNIAGAVHACFEWKGNPVFCIDTDELLGRIKNDFDRL